MSRCKWCLREDESPAPDNGLSDFCSPECEEKYEDYMHNANKNEKESYKQYLEGMIDPRD